MKWVNYAFALIWAVQCVTLVAGWDSLSHGQQIMASASSCVLFLRWARE